MEEYNWIDALYKGNKILVRQKVKGSEFLVDRDGEQYHITELDLTRNMFEPQIIPVDKSDELRWLLDSMDSHSNLDHKAKIDEREYWRKLRGDIALEIIRKRGDNGHYSKSCHYTLIAEMTKVLFNELYDQDKEFFKNK